MEVPIGPALVFIFTLGCVSAQDRFFISAPNVFHLGVKEKVFVQMGGSLLNRQVTLYLEAEHDQGKLMSDRVSTSCSRNGEITTVELMIDREKMAGLKAFVGTPYLMLVAEFPVAEGGRRVKQTRVLVSKHRGYIFIQTDQPIYTPQQKVRYRIFTLDHTMRPHQEENIHFSIINAAGNRIMKVERKVTGGIWSDSFNIPDVSETGTWKIQAHYEDDDSKSNVATREFKVQKFVMPSFEVNIQSEQSYVLLGAERLDFTITAQYSYGKKVKGSYHSRVGVIIPGSEEGPKAKPVFIKGLEMTGSIHHGEARYDLSTAKLNEHLQKQVNKELSDLEQSGAQLYMAVSVTDIYSGELQEADISLPVVSQRYTIDLSRTRSHFIPGVPLDVVVVVRHPNGSPATEVTVHVDVPTSGEEAHQVKTNQEGAALSTFNLPSSTSSSNDVDIEVTVEGQRERKAIGRASSQSNSYLYLSASRINPLPVGEYLSVTFQVIGGQPQDGTLYYMVISRGVLVEHGSLTSGLVSKHMLRITAAMIPSFRLIGYYYHSNGDVVADSVWVDVKDECEGKLKVTSSQHNLEPGKRATFKIDLEGKEAKVALLAVDKAIYALKANNKLTARQVFSSMMSYDLGCSYSGGSDLVSTFNGAGLAFLSPSESQQSLERKGFGCESRPTRNKRSLDLRQAFQNLTSNYTDETLQKCCSSGLQRIPMKRTCEERAQRVSQLNTDAEACTEAFLECCRQGEKLRERRRQEVAQRDFARTASESDIEEFFDQNTLHIRRHFPGSFEFTVLDVKGEKSHSLVLPDSITTWEMQAVSLSASHGFCVAEPYEFKVFKRIFVSLRLPYSVRRYEQIAIEPVIYNYGDEEVQIAVHMAQSPGLCSPGSATSISYVNITVQPESSQLVSFSAVPMETGEIPVKIHLYSRTREMGVDAIEKMLKVSTEGIVERVEVGAEVVKLEGRSSSTSLRFIDGQLPDNTVPDSSSNIFIKIEGTGDGFGESTARTLLSPEGVSGLLRLPFGCAEQTMKMLAPTAIALRYLDDGQLWRELPPGTRDKALHTTEQGYMRILTYRKRDGSYGAWLHRPSSYWLSGLVVKVLSMVAERQTVKQEQGRGSQFVSPEEITLSARYLVSVQSGDGSFKDPHPVLHREMQGGMGGKEQEASMTAFITIALKRSLQFIASGNSSAEERRQVENSIDRSMVYLVSQMDGLQRPYAVAITAYCLSLCLECLPHGHRDAAIAWKKLQDLATKPDKDGCRSWTASDAALREEVVGTSWARTPSAEAVSVETTAYALLTAVAHRDTEWAKSAACWLTSQENYGGGFKSTQDTLIALEALSEYDLSTRTTPKEPTNMDIVFSVQGKSTLVKMTLRDSSDKVETELKKLIGNNITMQLTGMGETKIRVVKVYHLMEPKDKCELLSIKVKVEGKVQYTAKIEENYDYYDDEDYQSDGGAVREEPVPPSAIEWFDARSRRRRDTQQSLSALNAVNYEVCISHSLSRNLTGMAIADIRLLSGFEAQITDLEKLKETPEQYISHYEVIQGRVVLYFNELLNASECITFGAVQNVPVGLLQPASASVYDYYEPDRKCTVFYSAPQRSKMVSKLCSGDVCQCAERPCHKERSVSGANKSDERQQHACYYPTVDYGFIVEVLNVSVKSNFELYTTRVLEVLKANGDTLVTVSDTRVFAKRFQCKGKLVTGKQYLIMGKDGETTDSNGKMQYLLESNTWIEQKLGAEQCKGSKKKQFCRWFKDFVSEYQTDGCRQ